MTLPPPRLTNLPLVAGLLGVSSIVDYGGGSGWAFEALKAFCPQLDLQLFAVIELPEVVNAFNLQPIEDNRLSYTSFDQASSLPAVDLMYANAALHYAESEQAFLETASKLGPVRHLLLDGFLAHPDFEFYFVQRLYGHEIPVRIPNLNASLAALNDNGYRVTSCTPMLGPVSGLQRYNLPLEHFGDPYIRTGRYCITAVKG
jgi:putative methyltransferase (TIGR04325 family)